MFRRTIAFGIDLALWYMVFLPSYYDMLNRDNPMAYDRLFNGVFEFITSIPIWILFTFVLEWISGGYSIGKFLLRLRVKKVNGEHLNFRHVVLRWLGNWADFYLTLGLGAGISLLCTNGEQRLGDLLANTRVVAVEHSLL